MIDPRSPSVRRRGIYVETRIDQPLDAIWQHTQDPGLHGRWDLRFSSITYMPRPSPDAPQRFRYATRIGFGLEIVGSGESSTRFEPETGERVSSLRFSSGDRRSLILTGSGYWRYCRAPDHVRFLTWYDYDTRFGRCGRAFDRLVFRPLLGWATAWSFDRLRLWLERGIPPDSALRLALVYTVSRFTVATVFLYQGLVPKLLARDPDELRMLGRIGLGDGDSGGAMQVVGAFELGLSLVLFVFWRSRWPLVLSIGLMPVALLGVGLTAPEYLSRAFNPVSLNLGVAALGVAALAALPDTPFASRCRRRTPENDR